MKFIFETLVTRQGGQPPSLVTMELANNQFVASFDYAGAGGVRFESLESQSEIVAKVDVMIKVLQFVDDHEFDVLDLMRPIYCDVVEATRRFRSDSEILVSQANVLKSCSEDNLIGANPAIKAIGVALHVEDNVSAIQVSYADLLAYMQNAAEQMNQAVNAFSELKVCISPLLVQWI